RNVGLNPGGRRPTPGLNLEVVSKCAVGCGPNLIRSARVRPAGCCRANQVRVFRLLDALGLSNLVRAAVFWPADADRANQVRGVSQVQVARAAQSEPTCSRIVASSSNECITCSCASSRAPATEPATSAWRI